MKIRIKLNALISCLLIISALVFSASAQTISPGAVIESFYNGYISEMNQKREPLGRNSPVKKHLSAQLPAKKIAAFERETDADYFFQSQEFFDDWENKFTVSKLVIKDAATSAIVTFPGEYPRVKVTLVKEKGEWKIAGVQNWAK